MALLIKDRMGSQASYLSTRQGGFTLVEIMIVVTIIAIVAAIALPNYQRYVIKSKRTDMMSELQNIALQIESRKLAQGSYSVISAKVKTDFETVYPKQGQALYDITITPNPLTSKWKITATPKTGTQMVNDGTLSLDYSGVKCRAAACGTDNSWNK